MIIVPGGQMSSKSFFIVHSKNQSLIFGKQLYFLEFFIIQCDININCKKFIRFY